MHDFGANPLFWGYLTLLIPFFAFAMLYLLKSPWWTNAPGRAIVILAVTLNVVLIRAVINIMFGQDWPGYVPTTVAMLMGAFASGWYLLWTLVRLQWDGRQERRELDRQAAECEELLDAPPAEQ